MFTRYHPAAPGGSYESLPTLVLLVQAFPAFLPLIIPPPPLPALSLFVYRRTSRVTAKRYADARESGESAPVNFTVKVFDYY